MNVLLTGYKGFIGQHMLRALEAKGHTVSTYEWGEVLPSILEQDWVIHLGAISSTTERDIEKVMQQNVDFTQQLYSACHTFGVNFQFSSSASVYGLVSSFSENAPLDPRTPYAWSKYLSERYINRRPMGSITQIFRYFNVYGPDGEEHKGKQASPYYQFSTQYKENGRIKVFENSENYLRDFISVSEIVKMHLQFMNIEQSGTWNMGTGTTKSFLDVALSIAPPDCIDKIPMPIELQDSYQKYTCANIDRLRATLA